MIQTRRKSDPSLHCGLMNGGTTGVTAGCDIDLNAASAPDASAYGSLETPLSSGHPRGNRQSLRRGAAFVELAICLPILTVVIIGSIEVCDLIFLRNSLVSSAYVGTLAIDRVTSTEASVRSLISQTLDASRVKNYQINIQGPNLESFDASPVGSLIRIQIRAPFAANMRIGGVVNVGSDVTVNAVAVK